MGASNFSGFAFPKGPAKVIAVKAKQRTVARMDKVEKEKVRQRDKEACRVCGRKTRHVHERLFKSLGGVASLDNSICACPICHPYLQRHGIDVFGPTCNDKLTFEMQKAVAHVCFRGRAVPPHVTVT